MALFIHPLVFQSQDITISDWISVLTLCLAPLIAHVLIGAPSPTYLSLSRPPWHERLCHYNPTSILWRYAMVTDRRIRAKNWDRIDLAATNALFWTDEGWDGSEEIIQYSRPRCVQLPDDDRVTFLSRDAFKTLIITVQGLQAIILLLGSQIDPAAPGFTVFMGVDIIFFPVALFGLLRLCSCIWLTDEFSFASMEDVPLGTPQMIDCSTASFELLTTNPSLSGPQRYHNTSFWGSRVFRTAYVVAQLALIALALSFIVTLGGSFFYTFTTFVVILFYLFVIGVSALITIWYIGVKSSRSTVLPCISSVWYKFYTGLMLGFGIALIVIACIETRKTPCGKFTSGTGWQADAMACMGNAFDKTETRAVVDGPYNGTAWYGFMHAKNSSFVQAEYVDEHNHSFNFTRMCFSSMYGI
ncbi:hypothetical protein FPOAC2_09989 [Fusarium poae]|jgi:hypothetical protein|uniref:hypothetical protein n=1 Tax=Fusarium poae TaxID=36050 RepID=UPI001CEA4A36|nr:hypothetical protein FPOAC1_010045 [Fusarium poae]KAG8670616.1 hypothetical protein FPOAC1_010045 [Fusarium poae]